MNKIQKIRDSLKYLDNHKPCHKDTPIFDKFQELTTDDITKLITQLQTKSCELDVLPTNILKLYLNEQLPIITKFVNLSLKQGVFPSK